MIDFIHKTFILLIFILFPIALAGVLESVFPSDDIEVIDISEEFDKLKGMVRK